jgi:RHS repeat-associated protein
MKRLFTHLDRSIILHAILLCVMIVAPVALRAQTDRVPNVDKWQEYPRWLPPTRVTAFDMVVQQDGTVHLMYTGYEGTDACVYYLNNRLETRIAYGFSKPYRVVCRAQNSGAITSTYGVDIAASRDGRIAIAYGIVHQVAPYPYTDLALVEFRPGQGWSSEQVIAQGTGAVRSFLKPSLSYDDAGTLHIFYKEDVSVYDAQGQMTSHDEWIHYKVLGAATVSDVDHISGLNREIPSFVGKASESGIPQVAWIRGASPTYDIIYAVLQAGQWVRTVVESNSPATSVDFSIDGDNGAHVLWGNQVNTAWRYRFKKSGMTFNAAETVTMPTTGRALLAVDERRLPLTFTSAQVTKVNNPAVGNNPWITQWPLAIAGREMMQVPPVFLGLAAFQTSPGNEFSHVLDRYGWYTRTAEFNLGAQDENVLFSVGPNSAVNVATGNDHVNVPLFASRSGNGFSAAVSLLYNSFDGTVGDISQGWSHNYQMMLFDHDTSDPTGPVTVRMGDGRLVPYYYDASPTVKYHRAPDDFGEFPSFRKNTPSAGLYQLTTKYGIVFEFRHDGRLATIRDPNGNILTCVYGRNPDAVANANPIVDDTTTVLLEVRDSRYLPDDKGRPAVRFAYDSRYRLVQVTDPENHTYSIAYESVPANTDIRFGKLQSVTFDGAPAGQEVKWKFDYYANSRSGTGQPYPHRNLLAHIYTPRGSKENYAHQFGYQSDGRAFISTEPQVGSVVDETKIDATPVPTNAESKITYVDPAEPFSIPNTTGNVPKAIFTNRRGFNTTIEFQYKRCLADKITDAQQPVAGVLRHYFDGYNFTTPTASVPHYRNLIRTKDQRGSIYDYTYYDIAVPAQVKDNLKEVKRPDGDSPTDPPVFLPSITSVYTQDGLNSVSRLIDSKGYVTSFTHDTRGNLRRIDYPTVKLANGASQDAYEEFTYDDNGRTKTAQSENGCITNYEYTDEATGLATFIQRPGNSLKDAFTYTTLGYVKTSTPAGMGTTTNDYDGLYRLKSVTEPTTTAGTPVTIYEYDEDGNRVSVTDPKKNKDTNTFDRIGRLKTTTNPKQHSMRWEYDREGAVRLSADYETAAGDYSARTLYDEVGRAKQTDVKVKNPADASSPEWSTTNHTYYLDGLTKTVTTLGSTPGENQTRTYQYNARDLLIKETHPITSIIDQFCYDVNDNRTRSMSRDASKPKPFQFGSTTAYDERNRSKSVTQLSSDPGIDFCTKSTSEMLGVVTLFIRDPNGNVTKTIDPDENEQSIVVDCQDRPAEYKNGYGVTTGKTIYNDSKRTIEEQRINPETDHGITRKDDNSDHVASAPPAPEKFSISYYNAKGELDSAEDALGYVTSYRYDLNGNLVKVTNAAGRVDSIAYNELDQVVAEIRDKNGLNITVRYGRDNNGALDSLTDPKGRVWRFVKDDAGRTTETIWPDSTKTRISFDKSGRVKTETDRAGKVTTYYYDNESRLDSQRHGAPFNRTITYQNYSFGVPNVVSDGTMRIEDAYDTLGRKIKSVWFIEGKRFDSVSYEYTPGSLRKKFTDGPGRVTLYHYNKNGQLDTLTSDSNKFAFNYLTSGLRKATIFLNAQGTKIAETDESFDKRFNLTNMKTLAANNAILASYTYGYDPLGNRIWERDHRGGGENNRYDALYRLIVQEWFGNGPHHKDSVWYDKNGNRLGKVTYTGSTTYDYNIVNEMVGEHRNSVGNFLLLSPTAVTASSTQPGFDPVVAIDGKIDDRLVPAATWRSENTLGGDTLTVDFGSVKSVARIRLFALPATRFKLQVSSDGTQYEEIEIAEVSGAYQQENEAEWWSANDNVVTFTFTPRQARFVRYVLAAGGGSVSDPDVAWVNEIQTYSGEQTHYDITYLYDKNGNQTDKIAGTVHDQFFYDHINHMTGYKKFVGPDLKQHYSYLFAPTEALRVRKRNELDSLKESEYFNYDGLNECNSYTAQGDGTLKLTTTYIQELSLLSKLGSFSHQDRTYHFYIRDAIGTNRNYFDQNAHLGGEQYFDAFGNALGKRSNERYSFQQETYDVEGDSYDLEDRTYADGRFRQADKVNPILDHYVAFANNPVNRVDPTGMFIGYAASAEEDWYGYIAVRASLRFLSAWYGVNVSSKLLDQNTVKLTTGDVTPEFMQLPVWRMSDAQKFIKAVNDNQPRSLGKWINDMINSVPEAKMMLEHYIAEEVRHEELWEELRHYSGSELGMLQWREGKIVALRGGAIAGAAGVMTTIMCAIPEILPLAPAIQAIGCGVITVAETPQGQEALREAEQLLAEAVTSPAGQTLAEGEAANVSRFMEELAVHIHNHSQNWIPWLTNIASSREGQRTIMFAHRVASAQLNNLEVQSNPQLFRMFQNMQTLTGQFMNGRW